MQSAWVECDRLARDPVIGEMRRPSPAASHPFRDQRVEAADRDLRRNARLCDEQGSERIAELAGRGHLTEVGVRIRELLLHAERVRRDSKWVEIASEDFGERSDRQAKR